MNPGPGKDIILSGEGRGCGLRERVQGFLGMVKSWGSGQQALREEAGKGARARARPRRVPEARTRALASIA